MIPNAVAKALLMPGNRVRPPSPASNPLMPKREEPGSPHPSDRQGDDDGAGGDDRQRPED